MKNCRSHILPDKTQASLENPAGVCRLRPRPPHFRDAERTTQIVAKLRIHGVLVDSPGVLGLLTTRAGQAATRGEGTLLRGDCAASLQRSIVGPLNFRSAVVENYKISLEASKSKPWALSMGPASGVLMYLLHTTYFEAEKSSSPTSRAPRCAG